jgi:hypothetical protein
MARYRISQRCQWVTPWYTTDVPQAMTNPITFVKSEISPTAFISEAKTIAVNNAHCVALNGAWNSPRTFLDWARRGLVEGSEYGLSNGLTYAKRAACCRIDRLIRNYHFLRFGRANYPDKAALLESVGILVPSIIQELIIGPRNELEHEYVSPSVSGVRHAIQIADLFLAATDPVESEETIVALNMNILCSFGVGSGGEFATFKGWTEGSMLFLDVFEAPELAKIVDGRAGEIRFAKLASFSKSEAVELAQILHSHYSELSRGKSSASRFVYEELKSQAGF